MTSQQLNYCETVLNNQLSTKAYEVVSDKAKNLELFKEVDQILEFLYTDAANDFNPSLKKRLSKTPYVFISCI